MKENRLLLSSCWGEPFENSVTKGTEALPTTEAQYLSILNQYPASVPYQDRTNNQQSI
jgi:hypothetical protein